MREQDAARRAGRPLRTPLIILMLTNDTHISTDPNHIDGADLAQIGAVFVLRAERAHCGTRRLLGPIRGEARRANG